MSRMFDIGAEASVLGCVMLDGRALDEVELAVDEFYDPRYREIFSAMNALRVGLRPIDLTTLEAELDRVGKLAAVGGLAILSELQHLEPTADNVAYYADIVRDRALLRRVHLSASEIAAKSKSGGYDNAEEAITAYSREADEIQAKRPTQSRELDRVFADAWRVIADDMDRIAAGSAYADRVPTGFRDLDDALAGGLPIGVVTILGARPKIGKSALARSIVLYAARRGYAAHVFSPEDVAQVYAERAFAELCDVPLRAIRARRLSPAEMSRLSAAREQRGWPVEFDDTAGISSAQIRARVRRTKRQRNRNTALVVVDHVQLMDEPGTHEPKDRVGAAIRGLVRLARDERCAVLVLSQLTRQNDREDRRPRMSDLRETGELEQDARVILMLHRAKHPKTGRWLEGRPAELIVDKQSHGEDDLTVELDWDGPTTTYRTRFEKGGAW